MTMATTSHRLDADADADAEDKAVYLCTWSNVVAFSRRRQQLLTGPLLQYTANCTVNQGYLGTSTRPNCID
jgi:hypothetical protein